MPVNRRPTGGGAILMGEDQFGGLALMLRDWNGYKVPRELMRHFSTALCEGLRFSVLNPSFGARTTLK
ncbi:MAG: hypothetical protein Ct9H300mP28_19310 [Pseudomonadota bacterium]|nr:MAG: hypothetical protein Ct9H300mP28_19310 [Pseudomonadota bacterium]